MRSVENLYRTFLDNGTDFFTGVPDFLLADICAYITDHAPARKHIIAANEGTALGLACGNFMATGRIPIVYMQNSGLGNAVNPLLSLADEKVYSIPLIMMIGWHGEPEIKDEPQHIKQGEVTLDLLRTMGIPYIVLDQEEAAGLQSVKDIIEQTHVSSRPHAIVIRKGTFGKYKLTKRAHAGFPVSREEALKLVVDSLGNHDIVVSTTGKLSRELFEYREQKGHGHEGDFLTVGSMSHNSSIALGIALEKPDRNVYCLDGDGAFIMHMGGISNIGDISLPNYKHIIFNNGAHESVGGQPTMGLSMNIPDIARACRYEHVYTAQTKEQMVELLKMIGQIEGTVLLELKVKIDSRDNLGRPTTTPIENKEGFMEYLNS